MKILNTKCPYCKTPITLNLADKQADERYCAYLVAYQPRHSEDYAKCEEMLHKRFSGCYWTIFDGAGILVDGSHAHYIRDQINLHLGSLLQYLAVFQVNSDSALTFPRMAYDYQRDIENLLGIYDNI